MVTGNERFQQASRCLTHLQHASVRLHTTAGTSSHIVTQGNSLEVKAFFERGSGFGWYIDCRDMIGPHCYTGSRYLAANPFTIPTGVLATPVASCCSSPDHSEYINRLEMGSPHSLVQRISRKPSIARVQEIGYSVSIHE